MIETVSSIGDLFWRVYANVRPALSVQYARWVAQAQLIGNPELRCQALASLALKKFHLEGGMVYAAQVPLHTHTLVPAITAYQTLCDYLDNLCDRSTSQNEDDFRQLHTSLQDAVTPGASIRNYYAYRCEQDDGGYIAALVQTCQANCALLPAYSLVQARVHKLSLLYSDLQVYKHIALPLREPALRRWHNEHCSDYPQLKWQEFAAATGSTLAIFELLCEAGDTAPDNETKTPSLDEAYFPWITALHILLDYLVDLEEDHLGGDLNFVQYYGSDAETLARMSFILHRARAAVDLVPAHRRRFHHLVIDGLVAFYLADNKVKVSHGRGSVVARDLRRQVGFVNRTLSVLHRQITGQ